MKWMRNQRGVAMVTVLFVAATLTVVASTATFITIKEFQSSLDDRQGASSLSYAEAGIDRLLLSLRGAGRSTYGSIRVAGCNGSALAAPDPLAASTIRTSGTPTLSDNGFYEAVLTVWPLTNARCATSVTAPSPRQPREFAIFASGCLRPNTISGVTTCSREAAGRRPEATTVLRQLVTIRALDLPIGLYGDSFNANGDKGQATNISLVSRNNIDSREKMSFYGTDPYYFKSDFYPCTGSLTAPSQCALPPVNPDAPTTAERMVASAHAVDQLLCKNCTGSGTSVEHAADYRVNCAANGTTAPATKQQSVWDGSVGGKDPLVAADFANPSCTGANLFTPTIGSNTPPRSTFTAADANRVAPLISTIFTEDDFLFFKEEAKSNGLYCTHAGGSRSCTRLGASINSPIQIRDGGDYNIAGMPNTFIAYFEFPSGNAFSNKVDWQANTVGCTDPSNTDPAAAGKSVVIIVRNGSVDMNNNNTTLTGAVLAPDGYFDASARDLKVHGTIIAKEIRASGGVDFVNSPCWVANMPGPFLNVTATRWSQIDR